MPPQMSQMSPQEIEDLINRVAKRFAAEVGEQIAQRLTTMGLNVEQPEQQRADLDHLRRWRINVEQIGRTGLTAVITLVSGAVLTILYYGAQVAMTLPKK